MRMRCALTIKLIEKNWDKSSRYITVELHNSGINDLDIINKILFNPDRAHSFKALIDKGVKRILQDYDYENNYYVDEIHISSMEISEVANYFLWIDLDSKEYHVSKVNFEMKMLDEEN